MFSYQKKKSNDQLLDKEEKAYYYINEKLENVIINFDKNSEEDSQVPKKPTHDEIIISRHSIEKIFNLQNLYLADLAPHLLFIFEYTVTEVQNKKVINYNISFDSVLKILKNFYVLPSDYTDDDYNFIKTNINSVLKIFKMAEIEGDLRIEYCDMSIIEESKNMKENLVKIFVIKKDKEEENYSKKLKRIKLFDYNLFFKNIDKKVNEIEDKLIKYNYKHINNSEFEKETITNDEDEKEKNMFENEEKESSNDENSEKKIILEKEFKKKDDSEPENFENEESSNKEEKFETEKEEKFEMNKLKKIK